MVKKYEACQPIANGCQSITVVWLPLDGAIGHSLAGVLYLRQGAAYHYSLFNETFLLYSLIHTAISKAVQVKRNE